MAWSPRTCWSSARARPASCSRCGSRSCGVRVRIIDKARRAGHDVARARRARAHARALRQLGLADRRRAPPASSRAAREPVGRAASAPRAASSATSARGLSPYPFVLIYPQDEHERLLIDAARARRRRASSGRASSSTFEQGPARRLRDARRTATTCDARVPRRLRRRALARRARSLGIGFPGGTYEHLFYVADVTPRGPAMDGELHVALEDDGLPRRLPARRRWPRAVHRHDPARAPASDPSLGRRLHGRPPAACRSTSRA